MTVKNWMWEEKEELVLLLRTHRPWTGSRLCSQPVMRPGRAVTRFFLVRNTRAFPFSLLGVTPG